MAAKAFHGVLSEMPEIRRNGIGRPSVSGDYVPNGNLVTRQQRSEAYNREMQGQPPKSDHENSIGVVLYWIIVYGFSILLGAICESIADILSVFVMPGVHVVFGNLPMLVLIVVLVAIGLTFFLRLSEKLIDEAISKTTPALRRFRCL